MYSCVVNYYQLLALSVLCLHYGFEASRQDSSNEHTNKCFMGKYKIKIYANFRVKTQNKVGAYSICKSCMRDQSQTQCSSPLGQQHLLRQKQSADKILHLTYEVYINKVIGYKLQQH